MTPTIPLNCAGFAEGLADYLEREDSPRMRAAVETHASTCAACGSLLADLQQLRVDAAGLPTLRPSRDLWPGIAERIATPVVPLDTIRGGMLGARSEVRGAREGRRAWLRPVAAAAALVAMTAGVTYFATREAVLRQTQVAVRPVDSAAIDPRAIVQHAIDSARQAERMATRVAVAPNDDRAPRTADRGPGVPAPRGYPPQAGGSDRVPATLASNPAPAAAIESVYGREIARLRRIVDQRRAQLDTASVHVIERNLTIIDRAIAESRAALARDPASAFLNEQLNDVLEQKIELLRAAALLPVRS